MKVKNLLLVICAIFIEFLRDYCFININLYIEYLENLSNGFEVFNHTDSLMLLILGNFKLKTLIIIKWILSLVFCIAFFELGILFSKFNFDLESHKKFLKPYTLGGLILLLTSLIIYLIGKFLTIENEFNFYFVSLEISHLVQSSLYPISFILIFWSYNLRISSS
tara:strand:+ start:3562 stop:4056 length:495 start_codon:yes stop_codon:yes gene_type:complete